jgi:integrase
MEGFVRSEQPAPPPRAGLRPRRCHDLRHAHARLLLLSGADIKVVSAALGHASISLTSSTYAGALPALRREAADGLARLLGEQI